MKKNNTSDKLSPSRQLLLDEIESNLDSGTLWKPGWVMRGAPKNAVTGKQYRGVNNLMLTLVGMARQYKSNVWLTFNQMVDKKWSFKTDEFGESLGKGAGVKVEFYDLLDKQTGKKFDKSTVAGMTDDEKREYMDKNVKPLRKSYTVFNGDVVDGIPENETDINVNPNDKNDRIETLFECWNAKHSKFVYGGEQAYYSIKTDEIHLPNRERFYSMQEFYSTALHELGHSTGHEKRLNRKVNNAFGTSEYALEELRAEIASMFIEQDYGVEVDEKHKRNNTAYISAWKKEIKDNPNALFIAIADAEKIAKYVSEQERIYTLANGEEAKQMRAKLDAMREKLKTENGPVLTDSVLVGENENDDGENGRG